MQVVLEKEKGCHFSNQYSVPLLSLQPTSTVLAQANTILSASPGLPFKPPTSSVSYLRSSAVGRQKARRQKSRNNKPRRSQQGRGERQTLFNGQERGSDRQEVQARHKIPFPCHVPPHGAGACCCESVGWKGQEEGTDSLNSAYKSLG